MDSERILKIFILKPEYLFGNKYLFTEYLFEKKKKEKGEKEPKFIQLLVSSGYL